MRHFYEKRRFEPAWLTDQGPRPQTAELLQAIDASALEGLDPQRYQKDRLASFLEEVKATESYDSPAAQRLLAYVDMHLTYTFLTLAAHLERSVFDPAVTTAVARFQRRHGLEITGKIDQDTLEELNVPAAARVRQIEINLERWRWMPGDLGSRLFDQDQVAEG